MSESAAARHRARHVQGLAYAATAFVAIVLCCVAVSGAEGSRDAPPGSDAEQPIHWRADHAEGDATGRTILTGDVQMEQGTLRVEADRMVIEYEGDRVVRITAEGDLARYRQRPRPDAAPVEADAERIVYHAVEERVELLGRAYLAQEPNEFRGQVIHYDVQAGRIDAAGDGDGSVEMIWQPERDADEGR
ncbi:MAG: lipopolysaccharide transport periplasmic protein LptA [Gammaproteobacteria bacterium]|nr:lipopolysaccharide transport periplasmic protein LptA [Gammaproteobacteria bacterium]